MKRFVLALIIVLCPFWAEASQWLKQSTAVTVMLGPFVDETDGFTAEDALTISQADIRLSKNGGTFAQTNNASGATHGENGYYSVPLNTTDTNTLGTLRVAVNESGALPVWQDFMVVPANTYDALISGSDVLTADVTQFGGTNGTFASGRPEVNATHFGGTAGTFASGRPEVNTTHWAGTAVGTATVRADLINVAGSAVNTAAAQLGVNVVNFGGSAGAFASGRPEVNTTHWSGTANATPDAAGYPKVTVKSGTGTGEISLTSGVAAASVGTGGITNTSFAAGAIDAAAIAADAIGASELAADSIGSSELAASAAMEIGSAVSSSATPPTNPGLAVPPDKQACVGFQQITDLSSAVTLTVPAGATWAIITVETAGIRWRDDGTAPTSSVGHPVAANGQAPFGANLSTVKLIETSAGAKINVSYYR